MRKYLYAAAGLLACLPLVLAGTANASPRPFNAPGNDTKNLIQNLIDTQYSSVYVQSKTQLLSLSDQGTVTFFEADYNTGEIREFNSPSKCVYYNASNYHLDILTCNASKKSDQWTYGYPQWSEIISVYDTSRCWWDEGWNVPLQVAACNGNGTTDKWQWTEE